MNIEIRKYEDKDYEDVNHLINEAFDTDKAKNLKDENIFEFVAVYDSKVVGYFSITRILNIIKNYHYGIIDYVCVDTNYRNKHIARHMMEYGIEFAKNNDYERLDLTSSFKREAARHLYQSMGFVMRDSNIFRMVLR